MSYFQFRQKIVRIFFEKAPDKTMRTDPSRMPIKGTRFGGVFHAGEPAD